MLYNLRLKYQFIFILFVPLISDLNPRNYAVFRIPCINLFSFSQINVLRNQCLKALKLRQFLCVKLTVIFADG